MPQPFVSKRVLEEIRKLPAYPRLKVVDLSCGEGEILSALAQDGCEAVGTHYKEGDYIIEKTDRLKGLKIVQDVNLHDALPFEDGEFDLVILTEVTEHLETYHTVVREAGRILKSGGHLVLTTPNTYRLHSRLRFLLRGHHKLIQRRLSWDLGPEDLYANHINMVNFPLLNTLLFQAGLRIDHLFFTRVKPQHFYVCLLHPIQWLMVRLGGVRTRGRSSIEIEGIRDQNRWMTHPAMSFSEQLALVARKGA